VSAELHIDWTRCDGHGSCTELLPELLGRDEWGFPVPGPSLRVSRELRSHAEHAVEVCPMLALRIVRR
jgi:ferredoxin